MTPCEKLGYKVGDRFEVVNSTHPNVPDNEVVILSEDDGTYSPFFKTESGTRCMLLREIRPLPSKTFTLRPGMYVSTEGMTESEYHQVARAFMAAGCPSDEYRRCDTMWDSYGYAGWQNGDSCGFSRWDHAVDFGDKATKITIAQALSTVPDEEEEGSMGWEPKVGERVGVVAETSRHMEYGKHLLGAEVEVKSTFMSGDVEVAAIEKDGACYCLRTSMLRPLPQKSERELAIDEMSRTIDNSVGGFSDATLGAISMVLYDAGYRKQ